MRKRRKKGFTMAELLIVVGIIGVLSAVAFIAVYRHLRSMTKLEYDGYAKEIFIAAQNHLSMAGHEGYLGMTSDKFGTPEPVISEVEGSGNGIYYFVYDKDNVGETSSVFNLMLPFGSVDDTIRAGGRYVVRYHKDSAQVLDVFYWSSTAQRFKHNYNNSDYANFLKDRADRETMKYYGTDQSVIGWYGGVDAKNLQRGEKLDSPSVVVKNAERLMVEITDPNMQNVLTKNTGALKLLLTGLSSGVEKEILLREKNSTNPKNYGWIETDVSGKITVLLDDITTAGRHFKDLFCSDSDAAKNLFPGENISIRAVAYNNEELTNIAYSSTQKTNSLFESLEAGTAGGAQDTALVGNLRHLENLGNNISGLDNDSHPAKTLNGETEPALHITKARQTTDLDWTDFVTAIKNAKGTTADVNVIAAESGSTPNQSGNNCFLPIVPSYGLSYSGLKKDAASLAAGEERVYRISNIAVSNEGNGGLIGEQSSEYAGRVSDLRLVDFSIVTSGNGCAGALAGIYNGTVENVAVYHSRNAGSVVGAGDSGNGKIKSAGTGAAGGLVGSLTGGSLTGCMAAVYVESQKGAAGGLIGAADGSDVVITACYAGGHTSEGSYYPAISNNRESYPYDVFSDEGDAGGLVGSFTGKSIIGSYSTCSVCSNSDSACAGGIAGECSVSEKVSGCYATGLIGGSGAEAGSSAARSSGVGSFAGSLSGTAESCGYFSMINYNPGYDVDQPNPAPCLGAVNAGDYTGISAMDADTAVFQAFSKAIIDDDGKVSNDSPAGAAAPYDQTLAQYFQWKYPLQTVQQLNAGDYSSYIVATHYGDWPSPEVFFINTPAAPGP